MENNNQIIGTFCEMCRNTMCMCKPMENKQETPLQRLIAHLENQILINKAKEETPYSDEKFMYKDIGRGLKDALRAVNQLLPYEREVIQRFGDKCTLIADVDFDGNVTFSQTPQEWFESTFKAE